jgi:beta-lactamase class A
MKHTPPRVVRPLVYIALGALLGLSCGVFYFWYRPVTQFADSVCQSNYPLLNGMIDCDTYNESAQEVKTLDKEFDESIAQYVHEGKAARVSVWVRDLNTKQWAATDETEPYIPASLLKVPIMIAYYKFAELEPSLLEQKIRYDGSLQVLTEDYAPATSTLVVGASYTIDDLIERMIVNSDNNAAALLAAHMDRQTADRIFIELGIKIPTTSDAFDFVTTKSYANIFRMLYNASYLDRNYSQKALSLLSKTSFTGIAEPLPAGTVVAHKFGERTVTASDGSVKHELHDCGIVYKTPRPYSICIMTEGSDFDALSEIIHDLSLIAYKHL